VYNWVNHVKQGSSLNIINLLGHLDRETFSQHQIVSWTNLL